MRSCVAMKISLVTGASSGIGREVAVGLARAGARVVMVCRDRGRGAEAAREVGKVGPEPVVVLGDLARQRDVRRIAAEVRKATERLDVLVLNAGIVSRERRVTVDGLEETFAVNHVAPFLLATLLEDRLVASAPARVVVVASQVEKRGRIDFDDLQAEHGWEPLKTYNQSKLANVLFAYALARRLEGRGVVVNAIHPGVIATNLLASYLGKTSLGLRDRLTNPGPATPAKMIVKLALDPAFATTTGAYFHETRKAESSAASQDRAAQARLWEVTEALIAGSADESA